MFIEIERMNHQKFFLETERLYINVPEIINLDNWYNLQCDNEVVKHIRNGKSLDKLQVKKNLYNGSFPLDFFVKPFDRKIQRIGTYL